MTTAELEIDVEKVKQRMRDELDMDEQDIIEAIAFADRARAPLDEFVAGMIRIRAENRKSA